MKRILGTIGIVAALATLTFAHGPGNKVVKVKPATYVVVKPIGAKMIPLERYMRVQSKARLVTVKKAQFVNHDVHAHRIIAVAR